ncbi:hypothetical protein Unana1_04851 [Umbelopsis nana]|jgi:hypothetical protein
MAALFKIVSFKKNNNKSASVKSQNSSQHMMHRKSGAVPAIPVKALYVSLL